MNIYELASEISLTQLSLAETLSFLGKPLDLLLGLYFSFPVDRHTENWCIYCKSMDFSGWTKHITWSCTFPVSQTNTEKLQTTRSESSNWILHSCKISGPRGAGSGTGCMPCDGALCVSVREIVATFHTNSHLEH